MKAVRQKIREHLPILVVQQLRNMGILGTKPDCSLYSMRNLIYYMRRALPRSCWGCSASAVPRASPHQSQSASYRACQSFSNQTKKEAGYSTNKYC